MSKIIAHNTLPGVMLAVMTATVQSTLSPDAEASKLKNEKATPYHWLNVAIKDNNGDTQNGSAILWDKLFKQNPTDYVEGKTISIEIQLNGDAIGAAQVHLGNGRFDIANLITADELKKFKLVPAADAEVEEERIIKDNLVEKDMVV
ncbi:hypothetical protein [Winogradskyella sediminis]|uniref:hypothetical protein n=1 Tax=Winogradskyella sediminis TaxID=1382466 RepID=UPI003AA84E89